MTAINLKEAGSYCFHVSLLAVKLLLHFTLLQLLYRFVSRCRRHWNFLAGATGCYLSLSLSLFPQCCSQHWNIF